MTIIESKDDLEQYVGKYVTLKGEVSNTKIPTILGVDVTSENPDLRSQMAQAKGILQKTVVKAEDVDKYSSNRGAGTFYQLMNMKSGMEAQVKKIK